MPCTIIVGGQYGSEGKGKVTALTAAQLEEPWVVRCGGPNSGHTTNIGGKEVVLRQIPAAAGHPNAMLLISAGCAVSEEIVLDEVNSYDLPRDQVVVDPRAVLVEKADIEAEQALYESIGSTASGTGSALSRRMLRGSRVRLVGDSEMLRERVTIKSVAPLLHDCLDRGGDVIVEGTQGFGLSLLHSPHYPHVTSRDTSASAFASEVGLSPRQIDDIIMVIRTFPIRVGGRSGPLDGEISWEEIKRISGAPDVYRELTSVTRRTRRVGRFDFRAIRSAYRCNRPTALAVMGLDRLNHANEGATEATDLTEDAEEFLLRLEMDLGVPVRWVGTGFRTFEAIKVNADSVRPPHYV